MGKLKLRSKDIRAIGYPEGPVISIAMNIMEKKYKFEKEDHVMNLLREILASPVEYANDAVLGLIAQQLLPKPYRRQPATGGMEDATDPGSEAATVSLNNTGIRFSVFGKEQVGPEAMNQMYQAAKLPIAVAAALMPDAHAGYGLPIGGVLATENTVIPYGVGVDIGCRMCICFRTPAPGHSAHRSQSIIPASPGRRDACPDRQTISPGSASTNRKAWNTGWP